MPKLHVTLADGFTNDRVTISVDGRTVFAKDGITSQALLGIADSFDINVPRGRATVVVSLDTRRIEHSFPIDVRGDLKLALYVDEGELRLASGPKIGFA